MFDAFCRIDMVDGESTDEKHKDWVELLGYRHEITQPLASSPSSPGAPSAGKSQHAPFSIFKALDKASPKLYEYCSSGVHLRQVIVELCNRGRDRTRYLEIRMEDVRIVAVVPTAAARGEGERPTEEIRFIYERIKWTYTAQKPDGSPGGDIAGGWNLSTNKVWS